MSKKIFSLIYGDRIQTAPQTKILPAEEFSTLLTAQEVFLKIQEDAKRYKREVVEECEKLKEEAQLEGFNAGFTKWTAYIAQLEDQIHKVRSELEKMVIPVALKAAKKIIGREVELNADTVVDIVANNLKAVSQHKKITIFVNRKDLSVVEANRPRLKALFENLEALSIRDRSDVNQGGCIIETEGGIINAQIDQLWLALEKAFDAIMKNKS